MNNNSTCPLCKIGNAIEFSHANNKLYHRCNVCSLIFLDKAFHPSEQEERERYETHINDPNDERYISHLKQITDPLLKYIKPGMTGLDYGCGEGKPISYILAKESILVKNYDPFFFNDRQVLDNKYHFIVCTETAEHFHNPSKEFTLFKKMLYPGGFLAIMTNFYSDEIEFDEWWYPRDPTHVCFYSEKTINWICSNLNFEKILFENNITILKNM